MSGASFRVPAHRRAAAGPPQAAAFALLVLLASGGCQLQSVDREHSAYYTVPAGTRLAVQQRLVVPPRKWSVYFQQGVAVSFGSVDEYRPWCELLVHGPQAHEQIIEPQAFEVTQVREQVAAATPAGTRLAAAAMVAAGLLDREYVLYETLMTLRHEPASDVTQLRCAHLQESGLGNFVTLAMMREALGELIILTLPDG